MWLHTPHEYVPVCIVPSTLSIPTSISTFVSYYFDYFLNITSISIFHTPQFTLFLNVFNTY